MYPKSPLFLAVNPFTASWLIGPRIVTERTSDDQRLGSPEDKTFVAMLSIPSKKLTRL